MPVYALEEWVPEVDASCWVAPTATVIGKVRLAAGASVWWGAVLRGDTDLISVGEGSNIQDNAVLHTDPGVQLLVGPHVTVGHRAVLHGCTVGEGSLIGIGATVMNRVRIGKGCLVGAHALVTEGTEAPDGAVLLGAPARLVKMVTPEQRALLEASARVYVANGQHYRQHLRRVDED